MNVESDQSADFDLLADLEAESSTETDQDETSEAGSEAETSTETEEGSEETAEKPDTEETEEEETEAAKPKKPSGSERLKRRLERLEAENAELKARRPVEAGDQKATASAIEAEIGPPPKESDFDDYLSYERALTAYETEKRIVGREMKAKSAQAATAAQARVAELVEDHADRLDELEKRLPGSMAKIEKAKDLPVARHVGELILESEKSAQLQLHLAENPEKLAAFNRLTPVQAAREIGRLEARLSLPKPRTETKAPPPVRAVKGAAAPARDPSKMSMAEYERYFNARGAKKS